MHLLYTLTSAKRTLIVNGKRKMPHSPYVMKRISHLLELGIIRMWFGLLPHIWNNRRIRVIGTSMLHVATATAHAMCGVCTCERRAPAQSSVVIRSRHASHRLFITLLKRMRSNHIGRLDFHHNSESTNREIAADNPNGRQSAKHTTRPFPHSPKLVIIFIHANWYFKFWPPLSAWL